MRACDSRGRRSSHTPPQTPPPATVGTRGLCFFHMRSARSRTQILDPQALQRFWFGFCSAARAWVGGRASYRPWGGGRPPLGMHQCPPKSICSSSGLVLVWRIVAALPQFTHQGARWSGAGGAGSSSRRSSVARTFLTGPLWLPSASRRRRQIFVPDAPGATMMPQSPSLRMK